MAIFDSIFTAIAIEQDTTSDAKDGLGTDLLTRLVDLVFYWRCEQKSTITSADSDMTFLRSFDEVQELLNLFE